MGTQTIRTPKVLAMRGPVGTATPELLAARDAAVAAVAAANALVAPFADTINATPSLLTALGAGVAAGSSSLDAAMLATSRELIAPGAGVYRARGASKATLAGLGIVTLARDSTAYGQDKAGLYHLAAAGQLRTTDAGILIEGAGTNLGRPDALDNGVSSSAPAGGRFVLTKGVTPAIDADVALTGTRIAYSSSPGCGYQRYGGMAGVWAGAVQHEVSEIFAPGDERYLAYLDYSVGPIISILIDLGSAPGASMPTATIQSGPVTGLAFQMLPNGRIRMSFFVTPPDAGQRNKVWQRATASGPSDANGIAGQAMVTLFHEQHLPGSAITSPIPLAGTRAADTGSIALAPGYPTDTVLVNGARTTRAALAGSTAIALAEMSALAAGATIALFAVLQQPDRRLLAISDNGTTPYLIARPDRGTFFWNGSILGSEADVVAAIGAVGTGLGVAPGLSVGGYVAPDATDLLAGVDFTLDVQRFDFALADGVTVSTSGGYLVQSNGTGASGTCARRVKVPGGFAYRFAATAKRGTATSAVFLDAGADQYAFGYGQVSAGITGTDDQRVSTTVSANSGDQFVVGLLNFAGTQGQTVLMRAPSLVRVLPAPGFPSDSLTVRLTDVVIPNPLPQATQVLWQADAGSGAALARLAIELRSDGTIHVVHSVNGGASAVDIPLGAVVAGQTVRSIVAGKDLTATRAAMAGAGAEVEATIAAGLATMRIGHGDAGQAFTGALGGYEVRRGLEKLDWMRRVTASVPVELLKIWTEGDSYMAPGTGLCLFLADRGFDVYNTAEGGSTSADQTWRTLLPGNLADARARTYVRWDGSENGRLASWTGSIASGVLTVTDNADRSLRRGQLISIDGVSTGWRITGQRTSTEPDGVLIGGRGTYALALDGGGAGGDRASAAMTGTIVGTSRYDVQDYVDVVTALGHVRHLYIHSGRVSGLTGAQPTAVRSQGALDMDAVYAAIGARYGAIHTFDPWPLVCGFAISDPSVAGYAADQSDMQYGYFPRSVTTDGVHLRPDVRRAVEAALEAQLFAVATGRAVVDDYCRAWAPRALVAS